MDLFPTGSLITGTNLDNLLTGTAGDDTIQGLGGNDQLNGLDGNDSIEGGDGGDVINAGAGVDTVLGGAGADGIFGGSDNDSLDGGAGNDTINGEAGNDSIVGGSEIDSLYGGDGNDSLSGGDGNDSLQGDGGNDTLLGEAGNDTIYGNAGNDSSVGGDGADYLQDSEGNNTAQGGAGNDTIYGAGVIDGGADNDTLNYWTSYVNGAYVTATVFGGDGNDLIQEWGYNTTMNGTLLDGGAGNDTINGSNYNESILGGSGDDTIRGSGGNDTIDGDDGANIAIYTGSRSQYSVVGDAAGLTLYDNRIGTPDGVDVLRNVGVLRFSDQDVSVESGLTGVLLEGTSGNDPALIGTILNDTIRGLAGNDVLSGLAGNDLLEGGEGNDTLQGGSGDDTIDGGTGLNRAIFSGNRADYSISTTGGTLNGTTTVVDLQSAINGNDGTDVLTGVRLLQFLDQLYAINTPPLAVADSATTTEDTAISISLVSLIANDSDAEGDPLSIMGFSAVTNGTVSSSGDNFYYTPAANFNGTAVVKYTLSDGFSTTPGTLSIAISSVNDAPYGADKTITTLEDTAYNFTAADFGFSDPADAISASGANSFQSVILTSLAGAGTLSLCGVEVIAGQEITAGNLASLVYTPPVDANGNSLASFSFRVRDNGGIDNGGVALDPSPNTMLFDVTPVDDPGTISFNSSTYTVNENGTANIALTRVNGSNGAVSVNLASSNSSAIAGSDYINTPLTVTFADGQTSQTASIPLIDSNTYEQTETLGLALTNPTGGATLGIKQTATLTIIDDDAQPGVIQFTGSFFSISEDSTAAVVQVQRSDGQDGPVSVRINLSNGTALAGSDYISSPITVEFANGETTKTIVMPLIDDSILEATESIQLSLSNPTGGATLGSLTSTTLSILDNDTRPSLTLSFASASAAEGQTLQAIVTRTGGVSSPLLVALVNGNPSQISAPSAVTIPAGQTSVSFQVNVVDDSLIETTASVTVLATAQGYESGSGSFAVQPSDLVTLSIESSPGAILEKGGKATLTVTRSSVSDTPLQVLMSSSDTSEATVPASVLIPANQASTSVEILAVDDALVDGPQTVTISARPTYSNSSVVLPSGSASTSLQVLDDESASLTLNLDRGVIAETGTATATVRRNTATTAALTVNLTSSDTSEAVVPASMTIAAGQETATFTISGVNDEVSDGTQPIVITASAAGFNSGAAALDVSDIDVPDLVISQLAPVGSTYTRAQSQATFTVRNNGTTAAIGSWKDRVVLSINPTLDQGDTLLGEFAIGSAENPANLLPVVEFSRTFTYLAPASPGAYFLIAQTDSGQAVSEGSGSGETNNITVLPIAISPAYRASVYTDATTILPGSPVVLRGQALSNQTNSPVPFEFVKIQVENKGTVRELDAFTDANGLFSPQFTPLEGEGGLYNIKAYFPGYPQEDGTSEDSFTILGMRFEQGDQRLTQLNQRITEGTTFQGSVALQNLSTTGLSGLTAQAVGAPSDWTVHVYLPKTNLAGDEELRLDYAITVPDDKWSYYDFGLAVSTAEGAQATLPVRVDVNQLLPKLVADQSSLQASMLRGGQTLVEFQVRNEGAIPTGPMELRLPEATFLRAASPQSLPSLNVGESTKVSLLLQPGADQELTVYNGFIVVAGTEASLTLPFNFRAVSEAKGNLNINVVDELFFFAEGSPRLANAMITLTDPFSGRVIFSERDADGVLLKTGLDEGYYNLRITADSHDIFQQNIYIGAGETEGIQAFLSRQTVKYTWTVTPTEIEDIYTISVQSTFETDVPIPTVVVEPGSISLADLQVVGQVIQVDMKLTNHGLIAADDVRLDFGTHPFYKIEPLIAGVDILAAKSSITIPVRITLIADFDTLPSSTGELSILSGGSVPCDIRAATLYSYFCAGGTVQKATWIPITDAKGNCYLAGGITGYVNSGVNYYPPILFGHLEK